MPEFRPDRFEGDGVSAGISLRGLSTVVPPTILPQPGVRDVFAAQPGLNRLAQRIVTTSFDMSGIEHPVHRARGADLRRARGRAGVLRPADRRAAAPGTKARNEIYTEQATKLYVEAARAAIDATPGVEASDITHVVTVSCTGFYAPGPDYMLVRDLGLAPAVQRYHLGFMGCYAAIPALRTAKQFCEADPDAVVLVVSVELCTLHLRSSNDPDTIVASSLFADGAARGHRHGAPARAGRAPVRPRPLRDAHHARRRGRHGVEDRRPRLRDGALATRSRRSSTTTSRARSSRCSHPMPSSPTRWRRMPRATHRALGDPPGRPQHPRQGRVAARAHRGAARAGARDPARLRQHVERDGAVRAAQHPRARMPPPSGDRVCAMAFGPGLTVESALMTRTGLSGGAAHGSRRTPCDRGRPAARDRSRHRRAHGRPGRRPCDAATAPTPASALVNRVVVGLARACTGTGCGHCLSVTRPHTRCSTSARAGPTCRAPCCAGRARDGLRLEITAIDPDERAAAWAAALPPVAGLAFRRALERRAGRRGRAVRRRALEPRAAPPRRAPSSARSSPTPSGSSPGGVAVHGDIARSPLAYVGFCAGHAAVRAQPPRADRSSAPTD